LRIPGFDSLLKSVEMPELPDDLDRKRVGRLLRAARSVRDMSPRIERISGRLLGHPYRDCPLGGSAGTPEIFTASMGGFDCVTYVETVLALAASGSVEDFAENLRSIRYRDGVVEWRTRNHYMTAWIRENERAGFVSNQTRGRGVLLRDRRLNVVPGVPDRKVRVASIPKSAFLRRWADVETGDLAFFASTRRNLDVFHCGILIREGDTIRMRHAARSRRRVVEEPLSDFLDRNRMVGVILVRPEEAFSRAA